MNLMVLGASIMQIPALKEAKKMGHFVICCDGNPNAKGKELCDLFYPVDLKDKAGLLEIASNFNNKHGLNGVFTVGTDFSSSVAFITEKLSLPGISYQSALNATDKIRMRTLFKEHNVPSPNFIEYSNDMDLKDVASDLKYPLVVKPVDSMGARGVCRVDDFVQLDNAVKNSIEHSRTQRAIVEEYMDGAEFSLDALIYEGEVYIHGFADRHINFPPYFVEMGHTIPSSLKDEDMKAVIDVFTKGVKALGLDYGCAKGDMKLTSKGPMVGEIAARLSGGYMSGWTYPYSSGINLIKAGIELSLGEVPLFKEKAKKLYSSERAFISIPGIIKEVIKPEKLHKDVKDVFYNVTPGDKVVFPKNNVEKCGNVICVSDSYSKAQKNSLKTVNDIIIRLERSNVITEKYLYEDKILNKAFDIDFDLLKDLEDGVELEGKTIYLKPVDKVLKSRKKDWNDRTINSVLKQLSNFYQIEFDQSCNCGLDFYMAIINGSLQGVLYYLDSLEI